MKNHSAILDKTWDSDFFGFKIGYVEFSDPNLIDFADLVALQKEQDYKVVYAFSDVEIDSEITKNILHYYDSKITLEKSLPKQLDGSLKYDVVSDKEFDSALQLSYEAGKKSRFKLDPNFSSEAFLKLYEAWCVNSLNKEFADEVIGYFEDSQLLGMATVKVNENTANIGLISVLSGYQGKGIGQKLLDYSESYAVQSGCSKIKVPTQAINEQALSFYRKNGYHDIKVEHIYHLWLS